MNIKVEINLSLLSKRNWVLAEKMWGWLDSNQLKLLTWPWRRAKQARAVEEGGGSELSVSVIRPDDPCQHLTWGAAEWKMEGKKNKKVTFMFKALLSNLCCTFRLPFWHRPSCYWIRRERRTSFCRMGMGWAEWNYCTVFYFFFCFWQLYFMHLGLIQSTYVSLGIGVG